MKKKIIISGTEIEDIMDDNETEAPLKTENSASLKLGEIKGLQCCRIQQSSNWQ